MGNKPSQKEHEPIMDKHLFDIRSYNKQTLALFGTGKGDLIVYSITENRILTIHENLINGWVNSIVTYNNNKNAIVFGYKGSNAQIEICLSRGLRSTCPCFIS